MKQKVVCLGEIMLRLSPQGYERILQNQQLRASFAGSEANVCVSLSNFGIQSEFVTKLPNNSIGKAALKELRKHSVGTGNISLGGDRIGLFFVERGASQRPSLVVYDRKHSSIAEAEAKEFNWDVIFENCSWFHFSGVTPALSENAASIVKDAVKHAKRKNILVSCDLNYRKNLWSKESANTVMSDLMQFVDICIGNEEDASDVFGITAEGCNIQTGALDREKYETVGHKLIERFGFKTVAITLRESVSASSNYWSGLLMEKNECVFSNRYNIQIVDRVGSGDSFSAGIIYSLMNEYTLQNAIDFAVAASCLKHSIEGDFNLISFEEVQQLVDGNSSGRIRR
jgi:2-dehydro-3-deoxygluconokinase